jgi:SAM-dependent methyltransferase
MQQFSGPCPVCGGKHFAGADVLWPALISAWQLSTREVAYVNRQQGFHCTQCNNNLRAMSLSAAFLRTNKYNGTLNQFCQSMGGTRVLEINAAGSLTPILKQLPRHRLIEYPEFDMLDLSIDSESFDIVVHSDTLEHVPNPERALSECRRVLTKEGTCIFTVPIIVGRMSRTRDGLAPSFHGRSDILEDDQLVCTEFGADFWQVVLAAGFTSCEVFSLEFPSALAIIARK